MQRADVVNAVRIKTSRMQAGWWQWLFDTLVTLHVVSHTFGCGVYAPGLCVAARLWRGVSTNHDTLRRM